MRVPVLGNWARSRAEHGALGTLSKADMLAFGGVGITGALTSATRAFRTLATSEHLADHGPELHRLVRDASPAGRIYAARLLAKLRPGDQSVWAPLLEDDAVVTTAEGCIFDQVSVQLAVAGRMRSWDV